MIKVTIELWPKGYEKNKRLLATLDIANDGTGSKTVGNYRATLFNETGYTVATANVRGFERARKKVWHLLTRVLISMYGQGYGSC